MRAQFSALGLSLCSVKFLAALLFSEAYANDNKMSLTGFP